MALKEVIQVANSRLNSLKFVLFPRIDFNVIYIEKVLDEKSREDFFRGKRITDHKKAKKLEATKHA